MELYRCFWTFLLAHNQFNITYSAGSKNYETGGPNYLKTALGVNWLRMFNYKYRAGIGLDIFYSEGAGDRDPSGESNFGNSVSCAIVPSWEWVLTKKLYVPICIGFYLNRNTINDEETFFYERIGLRYRFADHFNTGVTIKAHKGAADFFE